MKLSKLFRLCAYEIVYYEAGHGVNYAFREDKDTLYIFFQGSYQKIDWIRNFLFTTKVYKEFRVHRGFNDAYQEVRDIILDEVYSKEYRTIYIIGYSHGAALATICHEDLVWHFPNINIVGYGFEAPRSIICCNRKVRQRWDNFTVIRTGCDIVTHVPPTIFGYRHVGHMLKIKGNTSLVENKLPKCIKYHYPQVVYAALLDYEKEENNNE